MLTTFFRFILGKDVGIADAFRLGKFKAERTHPLLIKLHSEWDRRLILRSSWKLKTYKDRIFINADESLDIRRERTLDRLKDRANQDGKNVDVVNGVLFVNDVATYSIEKGLLINQNQNE